MNKNEILLSLAKAIIEAEDTLEKGEHQGWWGDKGSQDPAFWGDDTTRHGKNCDRPKGHSGKCAVRHIGGAAEASKKPREKI